MLFFFNNTNVLYIADPELAGAYIQLELVLFTLNTHGSHDQYFEALVLHSIHNAINSMINFMFSDDTM